MTPSLPPKNPEDLQIPSTPKTKPIAHASSCSQSNKSHQVFLNIQQEGESSTKSSSVASTLSLQKKDIRELPFEDRLAAYKRKNPNLCTRQERHLLENHPSNKNSKGSFVGWSNLSQESLDEIIGPVSAEYIDTTHAYNAKQRANRKEWSHHELHKIKEHSSNQHLKGKYPYPLHEVSQESLDSVFPVPPELLIEEDKIAQAAEKKKSLQNRSWSSILNPSNAAKAIRASFRASNYLGSENQYYHRNKSRYSEIRVTPSNE